MLLLSVLTVALTLTADAFYLDSIIPPGVVVPAVAATPPPTVNYFLRDFNVTSNTTITPTSTSTPPLPSFLHGMTHYRLLPASFPGKMAYHFDGLATVLKFTVGNDGKKMSYRSKEFSSSAAVDYKKCIFYGTGTGPTLGTHICFTNPGVNLLPIEGQLWLTIDTSKWGRVDPDTLETVANASVKVTNSLVLNAHPACDRIANVCYVQYPCPHSASPISKDICFATLQPGATDMETVEVGRATMKKNKIIQHSHSPCLTENYVVSKVDAFVPRNPLNKNGGLLKFLHQGEDSLWFVLDRRTNETKLIEGDVSFVNNHFWNCYENDQGAVVIEAVAATEDYLDTYFGRNLAKSHPEWNEIFHSPLRCHLSWENATVVCAPFLTQKQEQKEEDILDPASTLFDYPTFNPHFKTKSYQYFYAIGIQSNTSAWFDRLVKVDVHNDTIVRSWSAPNIYLTEFDFVPATNKTTPEDEDDGVLISVIYNATSDKSSFAIFNATTLRPMAMYPLEHAVPFHAHGIVCKKGIPCFTNP